ncbi:MAG: PKD domain-containing protein [Phycisphaerae bacterium]|jgi:WD40 repeat protein
MRPRSPFGLTGIVATAACGVALIGWGCTGGLVGGGFAQSPRPFITLDRTRGIVPLTVQFNSDRSSDDRLIVSRMWDFGDGGVSSEIAPRHVYESTGEFTVTLTVTDNDGLSASATETIVVTEAPVAVIRVDRTTAENAPAVFNFDASASFDPDGEVVEYDWDFADGSRESEPALAHRFSEPGTYLVHLTVTDDTGVTGEARQLIAVGIPKPAIEILMPDQSVKELVLSQESPLWIRVSYASDPSAARFIRAGLDGDLDICDAQGFVFDAASGAEIRRTLGHQDRVRAALFLPGTEDLLTAGEDGIVLRTEVPTGDLLQQYLDTEPLTSLALAPNLASLVYGTVDGRVVLRSTSTGVVQRTFVGHTAAVNDVTFSANGAQILSGSADGHALVWDVATGAILRDLAHGAGVNAVAYSPVDPTFVATGGDDNLIRLWSIEGDVQIGVLAGHTGTVNDVLFTADGAGLLSASADDTIRLWNPFTGTTTRTYLGHTDDVLAIALSNSGTRLASGSADFTVRLWDFASGAEVLKLQPCVSRIESVAFSADDSQVAAGVGARTAIPLDTDPSNGNDLNLTYPAPLQLDTLTLRTDIRNEFFLWAEIDTDASDPVRDYADAHIVIVEPFDAAPNFADLPAPVSETDSYSLIVPPTEPRQVVNLGAMQAGDRVRLQFVTNPGYTATFAELDDYSIMLLDNDGEIVAWYTQRADVPVSSDNESIAAGLGPTSRIVIGEDTPNLICVIDGGVSLAVTITRQYAPGPVPVQQRVLLNFDGISSVAAGSHPVVAIPAFEDSPFIGSGAGQLNWDATDIAEFKEAVRTRLEEIYGAYDVQFFTTDDATPPQYPHINVYIGGTSTLGFLGAADGPDPRNSVLSGNAIVFAGTVLEAGDTFDPPSAGPPSPETFGQYCGTVAGYGVGLLMGLRPTEANNGATSLADIMRADGFEVGGRVTRTVQVSPASSTEQVLGLPAVGTQDALEYLQQVVGP